MPGSGGRLPVRSFIARTMSRIACWPFVTEYKLHKAGSLPPHSAHASAYVNRYALRGHPFSRRLRRCDGPNGLFEGTEQSVWNESRARGIDVPVAFRIPCATRCANIAVFPDPAPAITRSGMPGVVSFSPIPCSAACRCSGLSFSRWATDIARAISPWVSRRNSLLETLLRQLQLATSCALILPCACQRMPQFLQRLRVSRE